MAIIIIIIYSFQFGLVSTLQPFSRDIMLYLINLQKITLFDVINKLDVIIGGSRPLTSKTEFFVKIVDYLKLQTIIINNSISDAADVLEILWLYSISLTFDITMHVGVKSSWTEKMHKMILINSVHD